MNEDQGENKAGEDQAAQGAAESEPTEERSRMDAAKAFFRAMNAGGDASPADYGMGQPAAPAASSSGPCRSCEALSSQLGDAEKRASDAESHYKRMAADFENYRRRIDREREEFQAIGIQKVVETLLPALDDMDRAVSSLNAELPAEKLLESLKLVYSRIGRSLEQLGVKMMAPVGEHFDPRYHEPVQEITTSDFPDGSVMQELRKGYTLNDKVIRPALVNVASNSGGNVQAESNDKSHGSSADILATDEEGGKVYDLSGFEDENIPAAIQENNEETPTTGNRVLDE